MVRHEQEVARQREAIACSKLVQDLEVEENTAGSLVGPEWEGRSYRALVAMARS